MISAEAVRGYLNILKENDKKTEYRIAELAAQNGGRAYYVGGFVRDSILGIDSKDVDIEVHGLDPSVLAGILEQIGEPLTFGKSFGVYSLKGCGIDIAMPRREHAVGTGHRDFEVFVDPYIGTEKAARRRDFTINAIMRDVLSGEIIDHFGGLDDLEKGIIRHVDPDSFAEDPLRVLRAAQFASRFGFSVAPETADICSGIDISTLSRERVEEELKKALLKGKRPSVFFETLRSFGRLEPWFGMLNELVDLPQDPKYHPEGDVWVHTMQVIDRAAEYRDAVSDPYAFMLLCLCHDLGKIDVTEIVNGAIHSYGHETSGMSRVRDFISAFVSANDVKEYVMNMVPLHMKPNVAASARSAVKSTNRMFDSAKAPGDLVYFAMCDKPVFSGDTPFTGDSAFLFERLDVYKEMMSRPYVSGRDLVDAGLTPCPDFSKVLEYAHKLRLAGVEKKSALKQTLGFARSIGLE